MFEIEDQGFRFGWAIVRVAGTVKLRLKYHSRVFGLNDHAIPRPIQSISLAALHVLPRFSGGAPQATSVVRTERLSEAAPSLTVTCTLEIKLSKSIVRDARLKLTVIGEPASTR